MCLNHVTKCISSSPRHTSIVWLAGMMSLVATVAWGAHGGTAAENDGDRMLARYFEHETSRLAAASLENVTSWSDWTARLEIYRLQLLEMLGLDPMPERTPLKAVVTGKLAHRAFRVEKIHFQSRPGLYVTANLYLPKNQSAQSPAVLYVCGHSRSSKNGVSFGNKTKYQHHGAWFARNGFVCLVIDTLQLGEIEGIHHGTHRENMWWWNARGYTPAGVETWNCIRALDYLESRPEVDTTRIGVTGRSGGGAYSWYLAALDKRIKCVVPVAGITNLKDHVVDGCVEGHCDCMYMVNTYEWDYPQLAALVAPRALLIANSDQDEIFPLDGVLDVHEKVRRIYSLARARTNLGLNITVGPHKDTQVLQLHAFQWFNRHLLNEDAVIREVADSYFEPEELKVFNELPADQINTTVHETFTTIAPTPQPFSKLEAWSTQRDAWMKALREKCFRGWPDGDQASQLNLRTAFEAKSEDLRLRAYDFESQPNVTLRLYLLAPAQTPKGGFDRIVLEVLDERGWENLLDSLQSEFSQVLTDEFAARTAAMTKGTRRFTKELSNRPALLAFIAPRGVGLTSWTEDPFERKHIRRRFMLLGQTLDGMRVWDVRRTLQAVRMLDDVADSSIAIIAREQMAAIALYASLFEEPLHCLSLIYPPATHRTGPDFLNVQRVLDMPQAVAMAAERSELRLTCTNPEGWAFATETARQLGWDKFQLEQKARTGN